MHSPHFFKVYCRLGLPHAPIHSSKLNIGVEDAPEFILTKQFLSQFPKAEVSYYRFSNPEEVDEKDYWSVLRNNLEGCKLKINEKLKNGQVQIVIGGDNSVTFSSLLAVLSRFNPSKVGYIQFDSHGEANSFGGSISKNFHGMYMRPFLEVFDIEEIERLVPVKIPAENFLSMGNLDLDPDEIDLYQRLNIRNFNQTNIGQAGEFIKQFLQRFAHIHINFDIDVFDKSITPATGTPTQKGLFPEDIVPLLEIIKKHPSWSLDLVEVNPKMVGSKKTIKLAQKILQFMLKFA